MNKQLLPKPTARERERERERAKLVFSFSQNNCFEKEGYFSLKKLLFNIREENIFAFWNSVDSG